MALFSSGKSRQQPDAQNSLDGIKAMRWQDFEALIGEAFRRNGYSVEATGHGGLDGDVDLILRKSGRTDLVQCKQWKTRQVHVATVHEMWGLVGHHKADAMKIVCVGTFSADAKAFAQGKPIELIDGERLLELVRGVQVAAPIGKAEATPTPGIQEPTTATSPATPPCPRCGAAMYKRFNLQTNKMYWGCTKYPGCKGATPI